MALNWQYTGDLCDSKPHGEGILTFRDGKYVGLFVNGLKCGQGKITYRSGDYLTGEWKND